MQAKVDMFEGGGQHGQSPPMNAQSNSQSSPNASNAALCGTQRRPDEVRSYEVLQQISPALHPTPNASHQYQTPVPIVCMTTKGSQLHQRQQPHQHHEQGGTTLARSRFATSKTDDGLRLAQEQPCSQRYAIGPIWQRTARPVEPPDILRKLLLLPRLFQLQVFSSICLYRRPFC